jgi:CRP/FNR family transcriptional regulator, cyclic AMP receptor protein
MRTLTTLPASRSIQEIALRELARCGKRRTYPNKTILKQDQNRQSVYVILSGKMAVYIGQPDDREIRLQEYPAVSYVDTTALEAINDTALLRTEEPTVCAELSLDQVRAAVHGNPDIAMAMIANLAQCQGQASSSLGKIVLMDVYGRVKHLLGTLLYEPKENGHWSKDKLSQTDLAQRIGASRDMVGRILRDLVRGGYIDIHQKRFRILKRLPEHW